MVRARKNMYVVLLILIFSARPSHEDCRVLADCDEGNAQWTDLVSGATGRPGKRGAIGPRGQKGEPGIGVNVTELRAKLRGPEGPQLYYYSNTLTWESGKAFCKLFKKTLCSFDQICAPKAAARELIDEVIHGNHWVPVLDEHNDWVEIGDNHGAPCFRHNSRWSKPGWGMSTEVKVWKGHVYCCEIRPDTDSSLPDVKYQYIGKSTTYDKSEQHCTSQGRRLCYSSEICDDGKPLFGIVAGDHWVAMKDRRNGWIQIGNNPHGPCTHHSSGNGAPTWGTRTDGNLREYVGFVFCCA